jgi:penicillin-insensitive murein endopeptidase
VELPINGTGWLIPAPWSGRSHNWGTEELVSLIKRAAANVERTHPGAVLGVADLSVERGGPIVGHRSHQSGRDVDLIYYSKNRDGSPRKPDTFMAYYSATGVATYARAPKYDKNIEIRTFDVARNWALVKALLTDKATTVDQLFVSYRIKRWLLAYAKSIGEPAELVSLATRTLRRPRDGESHNDHMHLRIGCSEEDINLGRCRGGAFRRARGSRWYAKIPCPAPEVARAP